MKRLASFLFVIALFIGLFLLPETLLAQPGGGGGPGGGSDPGCWPPPCIPIDGGVGWLIAAGALYGGKKAYSSTQKEAENE
jgi:hypothetical protein